MLRLVQVTIAAGAEINPGFTGDYVRVHGAAVAIRFRTEEGDDFTLVQGQEANLSPFKKLLLSHAEATAQTFTIYVGSDGSVASSAEVSGVVEVTNFPVVQDVEVTNFPVDYTVYGASYASEASTTGNNAVAIVAPGANVNGMIIHEASFLYNDGTYGTGSMLAKATAPATVFDGDVILAPEKRFNDGAGTYVSSKLNRPIYIAPGKGLYIISTTGMSRFIRRVLYTLL